MKKSVVLTVILLSTAAFAMAPQQSGAIRIAAANYIFLDYPPPTSVQMKYVCNGAELQWSAPDIEIPDGYNVYRAAGQGGEWVILNSELVVNTTFTDFDIVIGDDFRYRVKAVYGNIESDPVNTDTYYLPDLAGLDYLLVGTGSTEDLNYWYQSILNSLGLEGAMVDNILPYCGDYLAELPVLWLVSYPPRQHPWDVTCDRDIALMDYLDRGGKVYIDDLYLTMVDTLAFNYLFYGITTCISYPFMGVDGTQGTFAEGLSFDLADTMWSSNMQPLMIGPPEGGEVLVDNVGCGCVDLYVDRQGYKAVVNSQAIHDFLDGPDGTRLEYFRRMLNFFGIVTAVDENDSPVLPEDYLVLKAYPNPFNSSVNLRIQSYPGSDFTVEIYDVTGRRIRSLHKSEGAQQVTWDGRNDFGEHTASGVYFARAVGDKLESSTVKLTLLK